VTSCARIVLSPERQGTARQRNAHRTSGTVDQGSTFTVFVRYKKLWRTVLRVVPTNECQCRTALAVFTVVHVVWRLQIVTWCAQASVFSDTTLAVKNNSDRSGAGAVVVAFNLT